jgi:hypothetical protein
MPAGPGSHGAGHGGGSHGQPYMRPARKAAPAPPPKAKIPALSAPLSRMRHVRKGAWAAVGAAIVATIVAVTFGAPTSCWRSKARRDAVNLLVETRDKVTGDPLSERFPKGDFRCANLSKGSGILGILVEAKDGEDPVTWYFDEGGKPHNVNQLAWAWTPAFPEAPRLTTEQLAAVRE